MKAVWRVGENGATKQQMRRSLPRGYLPDSAGGLCFYLGTVAVSALFGDSFVSYTDLAAGVVFDLHAEIRWAVC